jgi:glycosyltransferase involved in cell wall biosynthesis
MRPALDGFYGIPQETRLLFSSLSTLERFDLAGLLQMSVRRVRGGVRTRHSLSMALRLHRFSKTIVSLKSANSSDWIEAVGLWVSDMLHRWRLRWASWSGLGTLPLLHFETTFFQDFVWQQMFARSVPATERALVLRHDHRICSSPWRFMHMAGIERARILGRARYPRLETGGIDVFVAQTPYPGRVSPGTALVIHYHDAIPVLMPHTISDRAFHEASHFNALAANVRDGAWFVCVSEATRRELLTLFPEAHARAVTIHNMLPTHYYPSAAEPGRLPGIVRRHLYDEFISKDRKRKWQLARKFNSESEKSAFYSNALGAQARFLLMVSTLEPRKNHMRLLEAWQALRDSFDPNLKLVLVGHIGWDYQDTLDACLPAVEQGGLFMLHGVPADALRVLFRHAIVTVCPSIGEGFDFAGVEAMRCGGVTAASDIPVHREVYADASAYFDPYDTSSLVQVLHDLIYAGEAEIRREALRTTGLKHSERYLPGKILPQWSEFLQRVARVAPEG